jgi:putative salt-induced outer membrane protein
MIDHRVLTAATALIVLVATTPAWADDAPPPPPPQDVWIGKGQFGFLQSKGNSDAESINGNIDLSRYDGAWKNELLVTGLYGKSADIVSAERWDARQQTNYNFSDRLYMFGAFRYEHDLFNGFQYQASLTTGSGYKVIATDATSLTLQAGVGYRRLRPETLTMDSSGAVISRVPLEATGEIIGTAGADYSHKFNATTVLTNKFLMEAGSDNTMLQDNIALTVKMSTRLALSVGYAVIDNTNPAAPLKKVDTMTTVNIQFAF